MTDTIGRLAVIASILLLMWCLNWLDSSGVARLGNWQVWLIAIGGLIYFASVSLYSFYGEIALDLPSLIRSPSFRTVVLTNLVIVLSEEFQFRGLLHSMH